MKQAFYFYSLFVFTIILFIISLGVGKADIQFTEIIQALLFNSNEINQQLVLDFRLPKSITACLVGIALPIAGFLMQELFKNPLADPSVLGVTSMASLGVAFVIFLFSLMGLDSYLNNPWLIIIASFLGSIIALLLILTFASRVKSSSSLVILGFMLSGLAGAVIGTMQYFSSSEKIKSFLVWGFGSLSGLTWDQVGIFAAIVAIGVILSIFTLRGITALLLGEFYARSLGINVKQLRILILISTALLTAAATAFTGPIGFIGLAIPHICRSVLKTGDMKKLYRWIIVSGIFFTLLFSILTEIFPFGTLPINIITSLIGAPIVISILLNNKWEVRS